MEHAAYVLGSFWVVGKDGKSPLVITRGTLRSVLDEMVDPLQVSNYILVNTPRCTQECDHLSVRAPVDESHDTCV
jgi:hypothetical protein